MNTSTPSANDGSTPPDNDNTLTPQAVTDDTFEQNVLKSDLPVLVDFWAPWCGPCRTIAPILETIAIKWAGKLRVVKLNVDENSSIPSQYQITSIPTLLLFKDGKFVEQKVGVQQESKLTDWLKSLLTS